MAWTGRPQPSQFSPGDDFPDDWDDLLEPYQGRNMGCCAEAAWKASPALGYINAIFPTWERKQEKGLVGREAGGWSDDPNDQEKGVYEQGMEVQWRHVFLPWFKHLIENCHVLDLPDAQNLIKGEHKDPYFYTLQEIGENAQRLWNFIPRVLNEAAEKGEC